MKYNRGFIQILAVGIISAIIGAAVVLEIPFSWLEKFSPQKFGTVPTSISTATKFADFPAIYNTNNTTLYNEKFALSDWYATTSATQLVGIGTITTGTWNATALTVAYGGTGSTTLSVNQVLLGNGTTMLKTVSGFGTSGQFLTSAGAGAVPTWTSAAINQADSYNWTGLHFHSATTSFSGIIASSTATFPLTLNGVAYAFPSTQGASSTALMTDGSGNLSWNASGWNQLAETTGATVTRATTTFAARKDLRIVLEIASSTAAQELVFSVNGIFQDGAYFHKYSFNGGAWTNGGDHQFIRIPFNGVGTTSQKSITMEIVNTAYSNKLFNIEGIYNSTSTGMYYEKIIGKWFNTTNQITSICVWCTSDCNNYRLTVYGKND